MSRRIESHVETIHCQADKIFGFLADFNNFTKLLPEQVSNWQADRDSCSFEVKGLASLGLRITEKVPCNKIVMAGEGQLPFAFDITTSISEKAPAVCDVQLVVNSDMNSLIAMMAERPLANFVDMLVTKLREVMESPLA